MFLGDDFSGHSLTLASHCMLRMVSIGSTELKALQYQWIVLWTGFEPAAVSVHVDQNHTCSFSFMYPNLFIGSWHM